MKEKIGVLIIPTRNPKHNRQKSNFIDLQDNSKGNTKQFILMTIIFFIVVIVVVLIVQNQEPGTPPSLKKYAEGDTATIEFKVWADSDGDGEVEWTLSENTTVINSSITVTNKTDFIVDGNYIEGFFDNAVGLRENEVKKFYLDANIDEDQDDIDDKSLKRVKSFVIGAWANTKVLFEIKIISLTKLYINTTSTVEDVNFGEDLALNIPNFLIPSSISIFYF